MAEFNWPSGSGGGGTGDVVGPSSATNNSIARFDTTTGKLIQGSTAIVGDDGAISATVGTGNTTGAITVVQTFAPLPGSTGFKLTTGTTGTGGLGYYVGYDATITNGSGSDVYAFSATISNSGAESATLYGFASSLANSATSSTVYNFWADTPAANCLNYYGLYIAGPSTGTVSGENYSVKINAGNSYFGGRIIQVGAADLVQASIKGHSTQTSNILEVAKSDATNLLAVTNVNGTKIRGTTTNDSAATGFVGEYISATATTNCPATTTWGDGASIALTAGDWDVTVVANCDTNAATVTLFKFGVSTTTGNSTSGLSSGDTTIDVIPNSGSSEAGASIPNARFLLSASATVYFKLSATFSGGTPRIYNRISARRVR